MLRNVAQLAGAATETVNDVAETLRASARQSRTDADLLAVVELHVAVDRLNDVLFGLEVTA